jgi:hypothetical protein
MEPKAVRVQFLIHVPVLPKMAVNLFVNGKGCKVLVVPDYPAPVTDDNSPPQPPRDDKDKDKDDEDDNEATDHNDSDSHWKRRKTKAADPVPVVEPKAKPPSKQAAPAPMVVISARPKKAGVKPTKKKGTASAPVMVAPVRLLSSPSSAPAPRICQYGSNLNAGKSFAKKLAEAVSPAPPDSPLPISSDEDLPFVHEGKARSLAAAEREEIGWVSPEAEDSEQETLAQKCKKLKVGRSFEGVAKKLDLASEASVGLSVSKGKCSVAVAAHNSPSKEISTPSKLSKSGSAASTITSATPTSSVRRSERKKGQDKETVLEKAMRVQESKDSPGTSLPNPAFVLLSSIPDDHLLELASDSGLALLPGVGSSSELLSLVRPKEIAQAALAQAQVNFAIEKAASEAAVAISSAVNLSSPGIISPSIIPLSPSRKCPAGSAPNVPAARPKRNKRVPAVKPVCARTLRKTPARQARVSPRVSK